MVRILTTLLCCTGLLFAQIGSVQHHGHQVVTWLAAQDTPDTGNTTSYVLPSFTMEPNVLYLVAVVTSDGASLVHTHSVASGHSGVSWTQIQSTTFNTPAAPTERISLWRGSSTSRVSGTLTNTTSDAATGCHIAVIAAQHVDLSSPVVQSGFATNNTAAIGVTLSALGNTHENSVLLLVGGPSNGTVSAPTNSWAGLELVDNGYNTPATGLSVTVQDKARQTTAQVVKASAHWGAIAVELRAAP